MRLSTYLVLIALVACGDQDQVTTPGGSGTSSGPVVSRHLTPVLGLAVIQRAGCVACHSLGAALDVALPPTPAQPLSVLGQQVEVAVSKPSLISHFGGQDSDDLLAWVRSLASEPVAYEATDIPGGAIERGGQLVQELGCGACHSPRELDLAAATDYAHLTAFLREPQSRYPSIAHVALDKDEVAAVSAWLLREQKQEGGRSPGFGYEYFEMAIKNGDWPDVSGIEPTARGVVDKIDISKAARKANYALQFTSTIEVPADGEWKFATRSDDGSWLWIDGELVVENGGMKPTTRKDGSKQLSKGRHQLRVAYTQGGGGAALQVFWSGPGVSEEELPGSSATASVLQLVPPDREHEVPVAAAVERGRKAARARRCDACHAISDPEFEKLTAPLAVKPWSEFGSGGQAAECPMPLAVGLPDEVGELPKQLDAATHLQISMLADGCLSCHERNGKGGLPQAVREQLREIEDIGEEGLIPPDLTAVGRRLRPEWLERVVRDGHKVRDYVAMRMPAYGAEKAKQYSKWFAEVDAKGLVDEEPPFSVEAAQLGRELAGTGGRNCISCHTMSGRDSLGPQGMDLALQHERLRPGWFRDWLLKPSELRKNTRMPTLWLSGAEQDRKDADAVRTWLSLGEAAPLPSGFLTATNSLVIDPIERPVLHGAFLKGVSARCLAVGTPLRTHYAFDLAKPRLAWIWRGAFLDARGTWHGRAGQLVEPLGKDWQVVDDFVIEGGQTPRLLGQRRTDDGYPVLHVACGDARYQDEVRPLLKAGGSELVRTIRCEAGELVINFPSTEAYKAIVANQPAARHTLSAGQTMEIVYRW